MKLAPGTVFVVGAGASVPYGLPTGADLRDEIVHISLENNNEHLQTLRRLILESSGCPESEIRVLGTNLRDAAVGSIDEWVATNPWAVEIAKHAISATLLDKEYRQPVIPERHGFQREKDWLLYFLQHVFASEQGLGVAKIVTFNFDRIIEYRTLKAVMGRLRRDQAEAATEAARLEIVHVSGILGQPEWSAVPNRQMVAFGRPPNPESIRTAASQISFVHEPRAAAAIDHARSFICAAPLVAFVGFGFNAQNVEALDVRSCRVNTVFIGSAHGLDTAEARGIEAHFKRVLRLYDCDARQFLRHAPNLHRVKLRQPAPLDWEDYKQADRTFVERRNRRPEKPE